MGKRTFWKVVYVYSFSIIISIMCTLSNRRVDNCIHVDKNLVEIVIQVYTGNHCFSAFRKSGEYILMLNYFYFVKKPNKTSRNVKNDSTVLVLLTGNGLVEEKRIAGLYQSACCENGQSNRQPISNRGWFPLLIKHQRCTLSIYIAVKLCLVTKY